MPLPSHYFSPYNESDSNASKWEQFDCLFGVVGHGTKMSYKFDQMQARSFDDSFKFLICINTFIIFWNS